MIYVVSGLPRSGTSMMMKILQAGGLEVVTDQIRTADEDNPEGYFEVEQIKQLKEDASWLNDAEGKGVKVISMLLYDLPPSHAYTIFFMIRKMEEILASQKKMLERRGEPTDTLDDQKMGKNFAKHIRQIKGWLSQQAHCTVRYIDYNQTMQDPLKTIEQFKGMVPHLDKEKMLKAIHPTLYRNRR